MLKLGKLPDRTKTKVTFTASAKLNEDLQAYAALYRDAYKDAVSAEELIPLMLEAFLKSDAAFIKACKNGRQNAETGKQPATHAVKPSPSANIAPTTPPKQKEV
jgi:hypothetical protein